MENNNIVYVESHTTNMNVIITEIGKIIGVAPATGRVQKWFQDYSAFVYDSSNGNLLFFKTRYAGYWDTDKCIVDYKK